MTGLAAGGGAGPDVLWPRHPHVLDLRLQRVWLEKRRAEGGPRACDGPADPAM